MKFYVGMHIPAHAGHVEHAFISVNRVRGRIKPVPSSDWIMDSGAFREIEQFGGYRHGPEEYAAEVNRLAAINCGLTAVVSQDFMCEAFMLKRTGLSIAEHQSLTIARYDELRALVRSVYVMPVLQGYSLFDYIDHIDQYGDRLGNSMYVGVGSLCKRNVDVRQIETIVVAINNKRPDLRLHGFGIKTTALASGVVRDCLFSADSMAWSFHARKNGRSANDPNEAIQFSERLTTMPVQLGWRF